MRAALIQLEEAQGVLPVDREAYLQHLKNYRQGKQSFYTTHQILAVLMLNATIEAVNNPFLAGAKTDCAYYSGSHYLKCAIAPDSPCKDCSYYQQKNDLFN